MPPGIICTFFADRLRVVDLRGGFKPDLWDPLWADFDVDWRSQLFARGVEPPTWYMADDVVAAGLDGIMFPSQAHCGGTNLVIYRSSARSKAELHVYDPDGSLGAESLFKVS